MSTFLSSLFQRLSFFFKRSGVEDEVKDIYSKSKSALEAQYLDLPVAEATHKYAEAVGLVIHSLDNTEEAVLQLGGLVVVKIKSEGKSIVVAKTLSPKLILAFNNNSSLLQNPSAVYKMLLTEDRAGP